MATALADLHRSIIVLMAGVLAVFMSPAMAQPSTPIVVESYLIPSGDPGIQLYVRNKRPGTMTTFRADRTVLYVHGATQASETTFDLVLDGKSWMDYIAEHGWDVWLMNVRGYGGSTKPPEMDRPATDSPPIAPAVVAVRDVRAAVEHILGKRGLSRISLVGWLTDQEREESAWPSGLSSSRIVLPGTLVRTEGARFDRAPANYSVPRDALPGAFGVHPRRMAVAPSAC